MGGVVIGIEIGGQVRVRVDESGEQSGIAKINQGGRCGHARGAHGLEEIPPPVTTTTPGSTIFPVTLSNRRWALTT